MQIVAVETSVVSLPFDMGGPYTAFAGVPWTHMQILLVRVETADGYVGWGEAFGHVAIPVTKAALEGVVAPLVIGRSSGDIASLSASILHAVHLLGRNGAYVYAYSGIEIALWDIAAQRAGVPLHRYLGGDGTRTRLPAYASLLNYGTPELVAKNTAAAAALGYRHFKLHETTTDTVDAAITAANGGAIMLDVNCAWSVDRSCEMADRLLDRHMMWLEEPVWPPEDCAGLARVRARGIPISAGENVAGNFGFEALIAAKALDYAQPSVTKIGGIGEMLRVIDTCKRHGVKVAPHSPYFGPGLIATMHICAALIADPLVEILWLDMEANPFDPWVRIADGHVQLPPGPGLGCVPDPAVIERYRVGTKCRITK